MSKSAKKRSPASHGAANVTGKASRGNAGASKISEIELSSKQSRVVAMLQSPAGASIAAMMKATGWQQHSVRGFLVGVVRKRLKLKLDSAKVDGTRVYRLVGVTASKAASRQPARRSR